MQKQPARLWITVLFLGWLFNYLFIEHNPGISFALYALATLAGGFFLLMSDGMRPGRASLYLLPFILYFIIMTAIRQESMSAFLSHALTIFLMAGLAVTYTGGNWLQYSLADYFARAFSLVSSFFLRPAAFSNSLKKPAGEEKPASHFWPIVRGLALAIPILLIFGSLLVSADVIFAQRVEALTTLFRLENLSELIMRTCIILLTAYSLTATYLHASQNSNDEKLLGIEKPVLAPFLGITEGSIVLGSVVLLFASFVLIQFQYFFGGQANINLEGYTYAEYARRGFGELVTVAFFALLLFWGLTSFTKRETDTHRKLFSGLGIGLLALVGIMLISAYQRLVMYETVYGFTQLRTYTHVFMIWVAILLASVVILDILQRQRAFALIALLSALGFVISLTALNVDVFIFERNLARYEQGQVFDVGYAASLSPDMLPAAVREYDDPTHDAKTHDMLGALLTCSQNKASYIKNDTSWQAFHFSNYWAEKAMARVKDSLKAYKVSEVNYSFEVSTPLKQHYNCDTYIMD
jgi:hypothetical protein